MRQPTRQVNTAQILLAALKGLASLQLHTGAEISEQILSATQSCRRNLLCATKKIEACVKMYAAYSPSSGQVLPQYSKDYLDVLAITQLCSVNIDLIGSADTKEWGKAYQAFRRRITATAQDITKFISAEISAAEAKLVAEPPCRTSAKYPNGLPPRVPLSRRPIAKIFSQGSELLDNRPHKPQTFNWLYCQ
jgi:hypothetical protein